MPDTYLDLGFPDQADADLKRQAYIDALENGIPGYEATDGAPEVIIGEGTGEMAADNEALAIQVAAQVFRAFGQNIVGLVPVDETAATASTTWTLVNTAGYTIPAGTQVAIGQVTFVLPDDATVAPGSSTVAAVLLTSIDTGDATSGLTDTPTLIDQLAFVTSIALDAPTSGGHDAETDTSYNTRLVRKMRSFGRPTVAADFAERALEVDEVAAALVLDGYDAVALTSGNTRTVSIAVRNSSGGVVSSPAKTLIQTNILAEREPGWNVYVIDPTYTTIDATATVTIWDGYDQASVLAAVSAAIASWLNPATWGAPPSGDLPEWNLETTAFRSDLTAVVKNVDGVRHAVTRNLGARHAVTGVASTDVLTLTAHGFTSGLPVIFSGLTGGAPLVAGTVYYARDITTNTFKVAATAGGAAIDLTTDLTAGQISGLGTADLTLTGVAPLPLPGTIIVAAA